jgi:hypothetical protein
MAKTRVVDTGGKTNKVRVVMLDAELSDAAVSDFTNVLLNAFRPVQARTLDRAALKSPANGANGVHQQELLPDALDSDDGEPENIDEAPARTSGTPRTRQRYPQPDLVDDLDMTGSGLSFKDFVAQHDPKNHARRYLVATAWLNDHGKQATVNINKMYTAYKHAEWPMGNIKDWDLAFRNLASKDWLRRGETGEYSITTIGRGKLQKPAKLS